MVKAPSVWEVVMLPESASNTNVSRDSQSYHRSKTRRLPTTHVYLSSSC